MQYTYDMENVKESKEKGKARVDAYKKAMEVQQGKRGKRQKEGERQ